MQERIKKEKKDLEVSLGLFTGYLIAGFANMFVFDKTWTEAFSDKELLLGFVGIAVSVFIILKMKRKGKKP